MHTKQISITNPYYAKQMKKQGIKTDELKIVEHFFTPTEADLEKITRSIRGCKEIVDIGSGYGLLINELAKQNPGIDFLGIDTMYWDKKFQLPKAEKNVRFEFNGIEAMTSERFNRERRKFDGVICCWIPDQSDWGRMLSHLAKKKVILILSKKFATGTMETYTGMKAFGLGIEEMWESGESIIQIWRRDHVLPE